MLGHCISFSRQLGVLQVFLSMNDEQVELSSICMLALMFPVVPVERGSKSS